MSTISRIGAVALAVSIAIGGAAVTVPSAVAHSTGIHDNCTNLNKKWPHGVGRKDARDKTTGTPVRNFYRSTKQYNLAVSHNGTPVRNFYRSTKQYNLAVSHNGTLDRDGDKIACEKA